MAEQNDQDLKPGQQPRPSPVFGAVFLILLVLSTEASTMLQRHNDFCSGFGRFGVRLLVPAAFIVVNVLVGWYNRRRIWVIIIIGLSSLAVLWFIYHPC